MAQRKTAVVLGAGVVGLTTAVELLKRQWRVVVIAEHGPLDKRTTSQGAGGLWMPFHVEPAADSARWAETTLKQYVSEKACGGARARAIEMLTVLNLKPKPTPVSELPQWAQIPELTFQVLNRDDVHATGIAARVPPGVWGAWYFKAPVVHAEPYIECLLEEIHGYGGKLCFGPQYRCSSLRHALDLGLAELPHLPSGSRAVVNCTGLGANSVLGGDAGVIPGRGVVIKVRRPPGCDAVITSEIAPFTEDSPAYAIPRGPGLVTVGGTYLEDDYELKARPEELADMRQKAAYLYPQLADAEIAETWVGLRPVRHAGVRLEALRADWAGAAADTYVVHNFGHGGSGWTIMYGTAQEAVDALETQMLKRARL